jgi:ATP-dependent Clp protease ATP-binding subunit ClpB
MTSNMGSHEIQAAFESVLDFEEAEQKAKQKVIELLKHQVRPEFLNRIDDIVLFSPLTRKEIKKIVHLQLNQIRKRLQSQEIHLHTTEEAIFQLAKLGFDPQYGGRPVRRVLQQHVLNPLSKELLAGSLKRDQGVLLDFIDDRFIFRNSNTDPSGD